MTMELSIIIVNWNTKDLLKKCLESIYENYSRAGFEVIVADNNSGDGSSQMAEKYFPQVKLIKNKENYGFSKANNQAVRISKGSHILILNPDILIKKNALERLLDFLIENNSAGAAGAKLFNNDGSEQKSGYYRKYPSVTQITLFYTVLGKIFFRIPKVYSYYFEDIDYKCPHEVDQIPGACLMVKRKVYEQLNGFDEDYFIWYEDVDFCYRMRKNKWKLYYLPEAEIIHIGGQSFVNIGLGEKINLFYTGMLKYFYKNHSKIDYNLVKFIICFNFIIVNIVQILMYPFAINKRKNWKAGISARWRFIQNADRKK